MYRHEFHTCRLQTGQGSQNWKAHKYHAYCIFPPQYHTFIHVELEGSSLPFILTVSLRCGEWSPATNITGHLHAQNGNNWNLVINTLHGRLTDWCNMSHRRLTDWCNMSYRRLTDWCNVSYRRLTDWCNVSHRRLTDWCNVSHRRLTDWCNVSYGRLTDWCNVSHRRLTDWCSVSYRRLTDWCNVSYRRLTDWCNMSYRRLTDWCNVSYRRLIDWCNVSHWRLTDWCNLWWRCGLHAREHTNSICPKIWDQSQWLCGCPVKEQAAYFLITYVIILAAFFFDGSISRTIPRSVLLQAIVQHSHKVVAISSEFHCPLFTTAWHSIPQCTVSTRSVRHVPFASLSPMHPHQLSLQPQGPRPPHHVPPRQLLPTYLM